MMIDVTNSGREHNGIASSVKSARRIRAQNSRDFMKELLRTTDPVRLSWLLALLNDAGIEGIVLDTHTSILEGSIGAIPRRLMVAEEDHAAACRLLRDAGEELGA